VFVDDSTDVTLHRIILIFRFGWTDL